MLSEISVSAMDDQNLSRLSLGRCLGGSSDVSGPPLPRFRVDLELENGPCSRSPSGIGHPDDHGSCPLDVSQKSGVSPLDHGARGDDPLYRFQLRYGGAKRLRALLGFRGPPLFSSPRWYGFAGF